MNPVKLNDAYFFTIEPDGKKVRLVVTDGCNELVCRKETFNNLNRFCEEEASRIFKGRLQLLKQDDIILVEMKGNIIGTIATSNFLKNLNDIKITSF